MIHKLNQIVVFDKHLVFNRSTYFCLQYQIQICLGCLSSYLYIYVTDVYARGVNVNLTPLTSKRGALATGARGCSLWRSLLERPPPSWEYRVRDPLGTRYELGRCGPGRGCYIGAVTRTGVRFRGVNVTDVYARGVNVNLTPPLTSKRGAQATGARGCSLWCSLLERPPPAWESRVRDPLGTRNEFGLCGPGRGCYIYINI